MAQHNYFGFSAPVSQYGGPQPSAYGASPAAAYMATGQAYAAATAARPATQYSSYDPGHAAYAYTPAQTAQATRTAVVTVAVTPQYQAVQVKPTYTSGYGTTVRPMHNVAATPLAKPSAPAATYGYVTTPAYAAAAPPPVAAPTATTVVVSTQSGLNTGSSYDAALYSAATSYYQQKQQNLNTSTNWIKKEATASYGQKKVVGAGRGTFPFTAFKKKMPGVGMQQTHYCEVCKISCAGPQTYKEHLEGQKHKKKEAQLKAGNAPTNMRAGQSQLKCDLCDVTCTGTDAYTAHIRGAKHQKTVNLHQRLGKPIPSTEPTIVTAGEGNTTSETKSTKTVTSALKKVIAAPGVKFVGGTVLQSTNTGETKETKIAPTVEVSTPLDDTPDDLLLPGEKAIQPVGHEYIEESFDSTGKLVTFFCKLCDCKFNDPHAKNMHMKGRRHRTNYKKKVDPDLVVEVKPNTKVKRLQADRERSKAIRDMQRKQRDEDLAAVSEIRQLESDRFYYDKRGYNENFSDRVETNNDRHIMAKHQAIYPSELELSAIQIIVNACEKALKLVSDALHEELPPSKKDVDGKEMRTMKGVMRVGDLAKGLLLSDKLNVELVVLCSEKPTATLLNKVHSLLPSKLKEVSDDELTVTLSVADASVIVTNNTTPSTKCSVILTSPLMREDNADVADLSNSTPADILDKQKCIDALAALRHAKWFQARPSTIPSCVPLLRVLKDLKSREERFSAVPSWAIELLLERCMSTAVSTMGPGDAMRRFFESLSSGVILPGGPGVSDPCEKDPCDAFASLTLQMREKVTSYAQLCLRYLAFNQIHKILGMEALPNERPARKRPLSINAEEATDGKKEKTEAPEEVQK